MIISSAQKGDREAVLDIWESASRQAHAFLGEAILTDQKRLVADTYFASTEIWVAKEQRCVRGFIGLLPAEGGRAHVAGLFVMPSQQNRGIGRALLGHAQQLACVLEVETYADNTGALDFYKRCGFCEVERKTLYQGGKKWPVVCLRHDCSCQ